MDRVYYITTGADDPAWRGTDRAELQERWNALIGGRHTHDLSAWEWEQGGKVDLTLDLEIGRLGRLVLSMKLGLVALGLFVIVLAGVMSLIYYRDQVAEAERHARQNRYYIRINRRVVWGGQDRHDVGIQAHHHARRWPEALMTIEDTREELNLPYYMALQTGWLSE